MSSHLKSRLGLDGIKAGLLYEVLGKEGMADAALLATTIKAVPLTVIAARPMDEAISTAGGVRFELWMRAACVVPCLVFSVREKCSS